MIIKKGVQQMHMDLNGATKTVQDVFDVYRSVLNLGNNVSVLVDGREANMQTQVGDSNIVEFTVTEELRSKG